MKSIIIGLILIGVGVRYYMYRSKIPAFMVGERVKIEKTVEDTSRMSIGNLQVWLPEDQFVYGDRIRVIGKVYRRVTNINSDSLDLQIETISKIAEGKGLRREIEKIRVTTINRWQKWLPQDEAALASGILLGGSGNFSGSVKEDFRRVGISHIVAASGYNVMVAAAWITAIGWRIFGRRLAIPFVILSMILYMLLAGMGPPVVRAGIMGIVTVVGLALGRKSEAKWLLVISCGVMLVYKPEWLTSVSMQLSAGAMAAVIGVEGMVKIVKWPWSDGLMTLAVYVVTLPVILYWFGSLSIAAPVANMAVLWAVPLIMQLSAVASVAGWINQGAGQVLAWLAWPVLRWVTWVSEKLGGWSGASWTLGKISWQMVIVYYVFLCVLIYLIKRKLGKS